MPWTVFLDRDGVINRDRWPTPLRWEDVEILPGVPEALAGLTALGFRLFIVTNKTAVGWRILSAEENDRINGNLVDVLARAGVSIEKLYYCGHHPLRFCECRKPRPGMLLRAAAEFGVAPERSWMVGDNRRDVLAGEAFGARTILIAGSGERKRRLGPHASGADHVVVDLSEAARVIVAESRDGASSTSSPSTRSRMR